MITQEYMAILENKIREEEEKFLKSDDQFVAYSQC